jgi:ABC-type transport system substrate-binding protein
MKSRTILAGLVMLVTVLSAFAAMPATTVSAAAADEGTLYLAMQDDMEDFNTFNIGSNSVWKENVIGWGFEALAGLDYNSLPFPLLAESWDFDEPNLTVTIHLRHGVLFHDGTEMKAEDVVFSYQAERENTTYAGTLALAFDINGNGVATKTEMEAGVQWVDDYTVKMVMARAYGNFFSSGLGMRIIPKHIWSPDHVDSLGRLDTLWNDPQAAISTGPYKYKEGETDIYRVMERNEEYWGKDFVTPMGYSIFPQNVKTLYFKIYASLDTSVLALQAGDVDFIEWAIPSGRVAGLQADPNIKLSYLSENGYYYLAFNEKRQPMNSLAFRKAISYLIDKDQIVNVYMGGFGAKGDAVLPPFWGDWMNESVEKYPYDTPFDDTTTIPEDILAAAGFADVNDDGWLELPDNTPMEKIILLTPPADYDPIRIRAGQMIAKNMREIGINCEAKAIDFSTLVAKSNSYDYQMLELGWSLGTDPMNAVFDIFGPKGTSNNWGFWDVDNPNPLYKDLLGVNTLADTESQAMAEEVDRLGQLATGTFDIEDQIYYTRWGEGVVADAVPANVLYSKVNIEAYRNTWTGYLPYYGSLLIAGGNIFTLANLQPSGAVTPGATATVNAGISAPGNVGVGSTASGYVVAVDNDGKAVSDATVAMTVTPVSGTTDSVSVSPTSGTTGATGVFEFTITGEAIGFSFVKATVTKGGVSAEDTATVQAVTEYPKALYMAVKPDKPALGLGETTDVHLSVTDENGDPVEGANLTIDPNLVGYGYVEDTTSFTDADGQATTVYHAPATASEKNAHMMLTLSYSVSLEGYSWTGAAAATVVVMTYDPPDWTMARVDSVTTTALDSGSNVTTMTVQVVDDEGTPQADHKLGVIYSDESMVFDLPSVSSVTTDGTGIATLDLQLKDMADSKALRVTFLNTTVPNAVGTTVTLTYVGTTPPAEDMYGGYITYTESAQYLGPLGSLDVTVWVWDSAGDPADGINASLVIESTPYGTLSWTDDIYYDSLWDYEGISVSTFADGYGTSISGPFTSWFDYANWLEYGPESTNPATAWWISWPWGDLTGVPITAGSYTFNMYGIDVAHADVISRIAVVPEGLAYINATTGQYQVDGQTTISSGYVVGRSYQVVTPTYDIVKPIMTVELSDFDTTDVNILIKDQDDAPVEGADAYVYQNSARGDTDYAVSPNSGDPYWYDPIPTDANGEAVATIEALPISGVPTASIRADMYVKATLTGAISTFAQTQVMIFTKRTFVTIDAMDSVEMMGTEGLKVTANVVDWAGDPIPGLSVGLTSDMGTLWIDSDVTDDTGQVTFVVVPAVEQVKAAYMNLQVKTAGPSYDMSLASIKVALQNDKPTIAASVTAEGGSVVTGVNISLEGTVFDLNGLESVSVSVDGGTAQAVSGPAPGSQGSESRDVSRALGELTAGDHTVRINATDGLGVSNEVTITFTVSEPQEVEEKGTDWAMLGLAIAGWIVAVIAVVLLVMKRRKGPEAMTPGEAEVEKEEP